MNSRMSVFLFLISAFYSSAAAEQIHEAFVTPIQGSVILNAIDLKPPERFTERIPEQPGPIAEWIHGYWAWNEKKEDFEWICGVWRKPPPGHIWNSGFWKKFDEGYVRIPGFWHTEPAQNLEYIKKPPPAPVDEKIDNPKKLNLFFAMGYWQYNPQTNSYTWTPGTWTEMDENWVFNPAYYVWRPQGYVFIPAYWDWPLETRGSAYCTIFTEPPSRGMISTPTIILEPETIIETLFVCWPDYAYFFHYWWFYHPGFWEHHWCCTPPWWGWGSWWWFDWCRQWDLWWWWGNPGFPFPWWMPAALSGMIPPPPHELVPLIDKAHPPVFISQAGPIPLNNLLNAIDSLARNGRPILPSDPQIRKDILNTVEIPESEAKDVRPQGKEEGETPPKPWIKPIEEIEISSMPQTIPSLPKEPSVQPPIRRIPTSTPPSRRYRPQQPVEESQRYPPSRRPLRPWPPRRQQQTPQTTPQWTPPDQYAPPPHQLPSRPHRQNESQPPQTTPQSQHYINPDFMQRRQQIRQNIQQLRKRLRSQTNQPQSDDTLR